MSDHPLSRFLPGFAVTQFDDHTTPLEITAALTYVRLRRSEYTPSQRSEWQDRLRGWANGGIDVFAYIKHEDNPNAPLIALEFANGLVT